MRKVALFISLSLIVFSNSAFAQNDEGKSGTVYSSYGTGFPIMNNSVQEKGLGTFGLSINDPASPSLANPAFWGANAFSNASVAFDVTQYSVKDAFNEGDNSLFKLGSIQLVFPIQKNKLGLSVSLHPETVTSYDVSSNQEYELGDNTNEYFSNRTGTGGITKFEIGVGYQINENILVGYAPSYSFLTEMEKRTLVFLDGIARINSVDTKTNGAGFANRFGVVLNKKRIFSNRDMLQFGGTISLPIEFNAKREVVSTKIIGSQETEVQIEDVERADVSIPLKIGAGLTYSFNGSTSISAEAQFEEWDNAEYGFSGEDENVFKNRQVYGFGVQVNPTRRSTGRFLSNIKYNAGISYDSGHLELRNNEINTLWFSFGVGLLSPNLRTNSSLDLSFQYGKRGTTSNSLVKEDIFSVNLSVNLTELMFLKRKLN